MTARAMTAAALALAAASLAPVANARAQVPTDVVRSTVEDYIRPGYERLAQEADAMAGAMGRLCEAPAEPRLAQARAGLADLVTAWSAIEYVRFGPVAEESRLERMLFWPDRRGVALRQVQAILGEEDESATTAAGLAAKSVAVQGLNALEFVLFGSGGEALAAGGSGFRCRYGLAIAQNIDAIASILSAEWARPDGIAARLLTPSPGDPAYRSEADSLAEAIGILIFGFEALRDLRLTPALGAGPDEANPNVWIYRRSGLTKSSLEANWKGLRQLFAAMDIARLLAPEQDYLAGSVAFEFDNGERILAELDAPLVEAVGDASDHGRLTYLVILTRSLQDMFAEQLSPVLGLSTGFSALDGD